MRTFQQVTDLKSRNHRFAAFPIFLLLTTIGAIRSPFAASVSRPITVSATVARSCAISIDPELENALVDVDQIVTDQRVNSIVKIVCLRGAAQNVLIQIRRDSTKGLAQLTTLTEVMQQSGAMHTIASTRFPIELKRSDSIHRGVLPSKVNAFSGDWTLVKEDFFPAASSSSRHNRFLEDLGFNYIQTRRTLTKLSEPKRVNRKLKIEVLRPADG